MNAENPVLFNNKSSIFFSNLVTLFWMTTIVLMILNLQHLVNVNCDVRQSRCSKSTSKLFASKTAYRNVPSAPESGMTPEPVEYPGCEAMQVYFLGRHGTRYPGKYAFDRMVNRVPALQQLIVNASKSNLGEMCSEDIEAIKNWKPEMNESYIDHLTDEGRRELVEIGRRLWDRFPTLFYESYSPSRYVFRTTTAPRSQESAKAFVRGFFDTDTEDARFDLQTDDGLLLFYRRCDKWEQEVGGNEKAIGEYNDFIKLDDIASMMSDVSRRLGLNRNLTFVDVRNLYEMCRYDTAWNPGGNSSSWCNIFSDKDLDVLEYTEDLILYRKDGYAYAINYKQACPIIKNIVDDFSHSVHRDALRRMGLQPPPSPVGLFHFTHSGTLLKFYARLGLYRDDFPPMATNYRTQAMRERLWRTSLIQPFAANLVFVLFKCTTDDEYKVAAYAQEQEIILPNCTDVLCPLETFLETYKQMADTCDMHAICDKDGRSGSIDSKMITVERLRFNALLIILIACLE